MFDDEWPYYETIRGHASLLANWLISPADFEAHRDADFPLLIRCFNSAASNDMLSDGRNTEEEQAEQQILTAGVSGAVGARINRKAVYQSRFDSAALG